MSHPTCTDTNPDWGFYHEYLISIPLFIVLQAALAIRETMYHYHLRKRLRKIPVHTRLAYILLVWIGLSWSTVDFLRFVIDPRTNILNGTSACDILVYGVKTLPGIFYALFLFSILSRLETAFGKSYLAVSRSTIWIFRGWILVIFVAGVLYIFLDHEGGACIALWRPQDTDREFSHCALPMTPARSYLFLAAMGLVSILNVCLLILFTVKLRIILRNNRDDQQISFKFKSLIFKNGILTLIGNISTIGCPLLWMTTDIVAFLYFDILINSMVIGLCFKYNEKIYKRLCAPCIIGCFVNCDRSKSRSGRTTVVAYLRRENTFSTFSSPTATSGSSGSTTRTCVIEAAPTMTGMTSMSSPKVRSDTEMDLEEHQEVQSDTEVMDIQMVDDQSTLPLPDALKMPMDVSMDSVATNTIELQCPQEMVRDFST